MSRKLKILGLAFIAVAAMSTAGTASAQAAAFDYTGGGEAILFGEKTASHEQHVLTTSHGQAKCTQTLFEGTITASGSQHISLTPTYTGCTCFGLSCTIDVNGCKYAGSGTGQPALTGVIQIANCTTATGITLTALGGCTITIPPQVTGGHLVFTNNIQDLTANFTLNSITYQSHGSCPNPHGVATTQTNNGTYAGQATFQARQTTTTVQTTHNGHTYQKHQQNGLLRTFQAT